MGPPCGSIIHSAAGRNAVEGNECLAGPEPGEALARHAVESGGGVVNLHAVGVASSGDDHEVAFLDPDEGWQWKLRQFDGIPSHRKDPQSGSAGGRSQVSQRSAGRLRGREPAETVRRRHGEAGQLEEVCERRWPAIVERFLKAGPALRDKPRAPPLQRPARERPHRLERMPVRGGQADRCRRGHHEHSGGESAPPDPQTSLQLACVAVQPCTLCSWEHMSGQAPSPRGHSRRGRTAPCSVGPGGDNLRRQRPAPSRDAAVTLAS
jgi:hypothetical protein